MTYLQLINKVLRELREKTVSDLSADYTLLIGQFVNEAKTKVEQAWNWPALRTDISFNTVSGTQDYLLATTTQQSKLVYDTAGAPAVYITTDGHQSQLVEVGGEEHRKWIAYNQMSNARPSTFSTLRNTSGMTLSIYPKPDAVYAIQATVYIPQDELSVASTVLSVPADPVWQLALVYAASERGAGQTESIPVLQARADASLWAAITEESEDGELTFYEE